MIETIPAAEHTIYAAFPDSSQAERAAGALLDYGVRAADISIVSTEGHAEYLQGMDDFTAEGSACSLVDEADLEPVADPWYIPTVVQDYPDAHAPSTLGLSTTTSGDAAAGAAKGAGFGFGLGTLAALSCMVVPGVGLVVGGGMLAAAIACAAGATAAGAVAGGIHGFLVDQGIPNEAAERYSEAYHAGDTIVAVTLPSNGVDERTADQVLTKYRGNHISAYRS